MMAFRYTGGLFDILAGRVLDTAPETAKQIAEEIQEVLTKDQDPPGCGTPPEPLLPAPVPASSPSRDKSTPEHLNRYGQEFAGRRSRQPYGAT